jgi:hypothetical protein
LCHRYVAELVSLKELYIEPLVHPHRSPPPSQPNSPNFLSNVPDHPNESSGESELPSSVSIDHLPIASRFINERLELDSVHSSESTPKTEQGLWTHGEGSTSTQRLPEIIGEPNAPRFDNHTASLNSTNQHRFRSHNSLPAQPRPETAGRIDSEQTPSDSRSHPYANESQQIRHYLKGRAVPVAKKLHRPRGHMTSSSLLPPPIPEALKIVLEIIGNDMLKGHDALSIRLKDRYQEQYPLVRSLTDIWVDQVGSHR